MVKSQHHRKNAAHWISSSSIVCPFRQFSDDLSHVHTHSHTNFKITHSVLSVYSVQTSLTQITLHHCCCFFFPNRRSTWNLDYVHIRLYDFRKRKIMFIVFRSCFQMAKKWFRLFVSHWHPVHDMDLAPQGLDGPDFRLHVKFISSDEQWNVHSMFKHLTHL